jgi:hypothetical protein
MREPKDEPNRDLGAGFKHPGPKACLHILKHVGHGNSSEPMTMRRKASFGGRLNSTLGVGHEAWERLKIGRKESSVVHNTRTHLVISTQYVQQWQYQARHGSHSDDLTSPP